MHPQLIFWPVAAHMLLVLFLFALLGLRKARAIKHGTVELRKTALDNRQWPKDVIKVSNNIDNQFETPILFYLLCTILYILQGVSLITLALASAYVISRLIHAYVHTTRNYVPLRLCVFSIGVGILVLLLLNLVLTLI